MPCSVISHWSLHVQQINAMRRVVDGVETFPREQRNDARRRDCLLNSTESLCRKWISVVFLSANSVQ